MINSEEYNEKYIPGWHDRILSSAFEGTITKIIYYDSIDINLCVNKPVMGFYHIECKLID